MASKPKPKRLPKLTDAERHQRFLETAREVGASEDPKDFERAFEKIVRSSQTPVPSKRRKNSS
jgi:hypothetical protein